MSLFGWFKSTPQPGRDLAASSREASSGDQKSPRARARDETIDSADKRKNERARLRELLYKVVRESMVRVGVLSSSFKFKVLATDPRGRKFIVMMDLSRDFGSEISQLSEIERLICQTAKARYNIVVSSVYWRAEDGHGVQRPGDMPQSAQTRPDLSATKAPAAPPVHAPAPPAQDAHAAHRPTFDPVMADEISELKKALAAGAASGATAASAALPDRPKSKLTGYENTEIIESELPDTEIAQTEILDDEAPYPALSPTQYGELR